MKKIMDGNKACASVSYKFTEVAGIYPITPASPMAEHIENFSVLGEKNFFGDTVKVTEMQSEAGAIGAVHGLLQNGVFASTYTASQGLLLMLPNMYKIAGELLPCVINVAARTVATHALSIMGDHSDIYAARGTGFAFLASSSVQDVMDLTNVAYLSTLKGRVPFLNFFDGFRTSHEYNKIDVIDFDKVKLLMDNDAILSFRNNSLDIDNPTTRGTNQTDALYFENMEVRNKYYNNLPDIVNSYMEDINKITGRDYKPFNYYGHPKARNVVIAMGSICNTIKEYIDLTGEKLGLIEVHLFRPFSDKYLLKVLPKSVRKIAVLDRTKEPGSLAEPLCLDILSFVKKYNLDIDVIGGRYGLSSKNTNLNDIDALYEYLNTKSLREFTLGINDDVTNLSLERTSRIFNKDYDEILIYGYGSDGMVTTSKDILTIVGENTSRYVQGYFEYDSKKSGGLTKSHLRFSDKEIKSSYYVEHPKVVVSSRDTYLYRYDMISKMKDGGTFILNTSMDKVVMPKSFFDVMKKKNIKLFTIDASKIARECDIPNKISMIMEMAIFSATGLMNKDDAFKYISLMIENNFGKKGKSIVESNLKAIESAILSLKEVCLEDISTCDDNAFESDLFNSLKHDMPSRIKVSMFEKYDNGTYPSDMSKLEKTDKSLKVPNYDKEKCIMCNMCSFVCPHAVIRPYLLTNEEYEMAPDYIKEECKEAKIKDNDLMFTIGVSTCDCTGCSLCASICPTKAIEMKDKKEKEKLKYEYLKNISSKDVMSASSVKGSQFRKPCFSFSGACAGCGEATYLKLLSQLFGDNLMIANATGCSSIYGGILPGTPWNTPWINSLFEDNAEAGFGIRLAEDFMKRRIKNIMNETKDKVNSHNKELFDLYLNNYSKENSIKVYNELDYEDAKELTVLKKYIKEKSIWLVGGDGWAYDIGYGGIDHVLSMNKNVNILVLDTEVYSNTGGQASKSSRPGQKAKFASRGKKFSKKNLAKIALSYPHVYVGTISLGANYNHTIKTLLEAESYDGPSIIIAYSPCISHGIKEGMKNSLLEEKLAAESGYFPLFRYNPDGEKFTLDSKADFSLLDTLYKNENRYSSNEELLEKGKDDIKSYYEFLNSLQK